MLFDDVSGPVNSGVGLLRLMVLFDIEIISRRNYFPNLLFEVMDNYG
jgi:hypothetical protein